jgi:hypothetical protein
MTPKEHVALVKKYKFKSPWIGVDLDGTLAFSHHWGGYDYIGEPIPKMLKRVKQWLRQGKTVKIFSSRAEVGEKGIKPIQTWCVKHGLGKLEVTNIKDSGLVEIWDDLAIRVEENTGGICCRYKPNWKTKVIYQNGQSIR